MWAGHLPVGWQIPLLKTKRRVTVWEEVVGVGVSQIQATSVSALLLGVVGVLIEVVVYLWQSRSPSRVAAKYEVMSGDGGSHVVCVCVCVCMCVCVCVHVCISTAVRVQNSSSLLFIAGLKKNSTKISRDQTIVKMVTVFR